MPTIKTGSDTMTQKAGLLYGGFIHKNVAKSRATTLMHFIAHPRKALPPFKHILCGPQPKNTQSTKGLPRPKPKSGVTLYNGRLIHSTQIIPKTETNMLPNEPYSAPIVLISNQQNQLQDTYGFNTSPRPERWRSQVPLQRHRTQTHRRWRNR
jgi:hypothetical protein